MRDNFNHLRDYFNRLLNPNHFYFVQVLRRKKDDGQPPNFHVIRNYYFYTEEDFIKAKDGIKELCDNNNCRAYFWVNPRDSERIALETAKALITHVTDNTTRNSYRTYDHICGKIRCNAYVPYWIVDIDNLEDLDKVIKFIGAEKIVDKIETASGVHLITNKFNSDKFRRRFPEIDIHKDNPTLLYYAKV